MVIVKDEWDSDLEDFDVQMSQKISSQPDASEMSVSQYFCIYESMAMMHVNGSACIMTQCL